MQPSYISVMSIFTQQNRYTVPLFQRPYVWKRDDQWAPLWDDLRATAERVLAARGKPIASHFLGTVVLDQAANPTGSLQRREVIDGQQRLTTLQLVLKASEHALEELRISTSGDEKSSKAVDISARQIGSLTSNPAYAEEEEKYKVWPTNEDRVAFRDVMDSTQAEGPNLAHSRMAEAYGYFRGKFSEWLHLDRQGERATALASALKDHVRLIVLDLDESDEPQAIFETLNAHGTPLLPADLIKNWLLWEGTRQELETDKLYLTYWLHFDRESDYWRASIGTGHAARARVDTFLQNWLTRKVREPISTKHLYDRFLRFVETGGARNQNGSINVEALMADIAADSARFRTIENSTGITRFDTFLRRLRMLDIAVFHPLVMELMGRSGSDAADRDLFARAMESYLLRRMVCGLQTRAYGTLALHLLEKVAKLPVDQPAAPSVISELASSSEGTDVWPTDRDFRAEWIRRKFYGALRRSRVLMILRAIEEEYQLENTMSEPVFKFNFDVLEVEHILPRSWDDHWKLTDGLTRDERNWAIEGIGNLTLISGKLNKNLSNGPWLAPTGEPSKRNGLQDHSKLELNARLLKDNPAVWNEYTITQRANLLFETASNIWPSPASLGHENSISTDEFIDVPASEMSDRSFNRHSSHVVSMSELASGGNAGRSRQLLSTDSLQKLKVIGSAQHGSHRIVQYENGTILVETNGLVQQVTRPVLSEIAKEVGVDILNSAGNKKNTRSLGADVIKAIS